jgi:predicted ATPase/DNA-binding winged helix-turn-helix (wHTH) protein
MTQSEARSRDVISFGPFRLIASERLLTKDGAPVELGARTLDTLIALASRPNQVISKRELMAVVWPDAVVGEGSLRFHIAGLRKALGDGKDGARYIATLGGRGYCFVAAIAPPTGPSAANAPYNLGLPLGNLPSRLARMVGRADGVIALSAQLLGTRFVTVVGAGGIGKTTVAVAVGNELAEAFAGAVLFVDLGAISDPNLVTGSIATMLGLSVQAEDPAPSLIGYLRDKRLLLILDTCEHLMDVAATLAERIFAAAPQIHILTTSREALRVEGEHIYRLDPLAFPSSDHPLSAVTALTFPAVQLFVERVAASGARLNLSDADAAIVADICRKLDGVPLAIELTAGRVGAYGLHQTAALLDERLSLLWLGQRTAPQRQQTLKATLDWSYTLLSDLERQVLRGLAVFIGGFTLEAAQAVLSSGGDDTLHFLGAIESLVAKSMIVIQGNGSPTRYRLLDATRAYALELTIDDAEFAELAARHANYYRLWLSEAVAAWRTLASVSARAEHFADLANVRAALEWAFGVRGRVDIGVKLAAAAAPVFLAMSLLPECHRWSERALHALGAPTGGDAEEMQLQASLGMSLMFLYGMGDAARAALTRSLLIAEMRGDSRSQLQLLGQLHMFNIRNGNFNAALECARRSTIVAKTAADPTATALAHSLLGISLSYLCELEEARTEIEEALLHGAADRTDQVSVGFDYYTLAAAYLARTLWLQGYPDQATDRARQTVKDAMAMDHPVTLCIALIWAVSMFLWVGDLQSAKEHTDWLVSQAEIYALGPYLALGRGYRGELAIRQGHSRAGVEMLQSCLEELMPARHAVLRTPFNTSLAQGLAATGRFSEGVALLDEIIGRIGVNGDVSYMPEVLRVKGAIVLSMSSSNIDEAEHYFQQSLELSRKTGARAWELRTATDLAALMASRGDRNAARALLQPVLGQFDEGFETADLQAAERLLATMG